MMLEEIEMSPGEFLEIMGLAKGAADRARILGAPVCANPNVKLMGRLLGVQPLVNDFPGLLQAKAKDQDIFCRHHKQDLLAKI
jgi:hypothetical protein